MLQLELFETEDTERLRGEVERLKESNDRMRKALFARHGQLNKYYLDIIQRLDILERNICHNNNVDHFVDVTEMIENVS